MKRCVEIDRTEKRDLWLYGQGDIPLKGVGYLIRVTTPEGQGLTLVDFYESEEALELATRRGFWARLKHLFFPKPREIDGPVFIQMMMEDENA